MAVETHPEFTPSPKLNRYWETTPSVSKLLVPSKLTSSPLSGALLSTVSTAVGSRLLEAEVTVTLAVSAEVLSRPWLSRTRRLAVYVPAAE